MADLLAPLPEEATGTVVIDAPRASEVGGRSTHTDGA